MNDLLFVLVSIVNIGLPIFAVFSIIGLVIVNKRTNNNFKKFMTPKNAEIINSIELAK